MNSYKHLKNVLFHNIKTLSQVCSIFCVNPDADFTRNRKLDFETIMKIILCMGASSIKDELLKFNDFSIDTPSASAFVQARSKIKPEAFKALFDGFNKKLSRKSYFMATGYWPLMAVNCLLTIPSLTMKQLNEDMALLQNLTLPII